MLEGVEVRLGIDYFQEKEALNAIAQKVVFTGKIDEYFDYRFGKLEYRSLHFENQILDTKNFQGNAVVNYTAKEVPYTRIIEHKHFEFGEQEKTVVTKEYPHEFSKDNESYYPINNEKNQTLLKKYQELAIQETNVIFGGRLAEYKYYDMHQVFASALECVENLNN